MSSIPPVRRTHIRGNIMETCDKCDEIISLLCEDGGSCLSCKGYFCQYCHAKCRTEFGPKTCWFCTNDTKRRMFPNQKVLQFYYKKTGISLEDAYKEMHKEINEEQREVRKRKREEKKVTIKRKEEEKRRREEDEHCARMF